MTDRYFPPEADVAAWIIEQGLVGQSLPAMLDSLATRLMEAGIPLLRAFVAMPVVSPELRASSLIWTRRGGVSREDARHEDTNVFETSPFTPMLETGETFRRWRFDGSATGYPLLDGLQASGATDHVAYLVSFDPTETLALRGAAISFTTDHPGGFTEFDIERLTRFAPLVGLAACRHALTALVTDVLGAYVGHDAGQRVLRGEVRRGEGHRLSAALLFADLRGFTRVADADGAGIVARLGRHLAAMAEPIEAEGGEVLKFLGDGLLAAWAIGPDGPGPACAAALAAACEAQRRNAEVVAASGGGDLLGLDVALHLGEVFYGNIGAGSRLDFTVIGSAVNEASRIEGLCGSLGHPLLMSEPFAAVCGRPTVSLGHHVLRNVATPREVFTLPAA